jgi:hypothetical protein
MNLLHLVFTFNLVTAIFILVGCYYLHVKYDERIESNVSALPSGVSVAGVVGAGIALGLMSSVVTLFV